MNYDRVIRGMAAAPIITAEAIGRLNYELVSSRVCDLMNFKQAVHSWDELTPEHRQAWIDGAMRVLEAGR